MSRKIYMKANEGFRMQPKAECGDWNSMIFEHAVSENVIDENCLSLGHFVEIHSKRLRRTMELNKIQDKSMMNYG